MKLGAGHAVARLAVLASATALVAVAVPTGGAVARVAQPSYPQSPVRLVSKCPGRNAEVAQAAHGRFVYEAWIGCGIFAGIGFTRSTDGGRHFQPAQEVPGSVYRPPSVYSWDPSVAVGPNGTVYVGYMRQAHGKMYPIIAASHDHGRIFDQVKPLGSPHRKNFADRDFVALARNGDVYVTWDYGPSRAKVKVACSKHGSCSFTHGDLNAVIRRSTDGGRTWSPMHHVSPGYPAGGADISPLVVQRNGRIDVLFQRLPTNPNTYRLHRGNVWFTSSQDHGRSWSTPVRVGFPHRTISLRTWWIDGSLSIDRRGNLYAAWDTQSRTADVGWLAYSRDHGRSWSHPIRVNPDRDRAMHLLQAAGTGRHGVFVGWLTDAPARGYVADVRRFSIPGGWLTKPIRVSRRYGERKAWPGDTIGVTSRPQVSRDGTVMPRRVILSWGSKYRGTKRTQIRSRTVFFTKH